MPDTSTSKIVDQLLATNEDFAKLYNEHRSLDEKISELFESSRVGSSTHDLEIKRLKKLKLASKDAMQKMILEAEKSGS